MCQFIVRLVVMGALIAGTWSGVASADESLAPYGTAKVNLHPYPEINQVFDLNYTDPKKLNILYLFVKNMRKLVPGKTVVVTHGPELRVFAKENYIKYQGIVDRMAALAKDGVEFRMCSIAMKAAGFMATDMHGFITVIPAGFTELVYLQSQGYQYVNPLPYGVKGVRYLEHPEKKPK